MRVVFITNRDDYLYRFRGELLRTIMKQGHEVRALAGESSAAANMALKTMGVHLHYYKFDRTGLNLWNEAQAIYQIYKHLATLKPEVVFTNTIKLNAYGSLAARWAHVPHVYSLVSGIGSPFIEVKTFRKKLLRQTVVALLRWGLSDNRVIFFQNPDDLLELSRRKVIHKNMRTKVVNGSGIDTQHFSPAPATTDPITFLFLSRLQREKGVVEYVAAARMLRAVYPQARFRIVGPLDSHPQALPKEDLLRWTTEGTIEYHEAVEDVRPILAQSSVVVLPSYREGTPRSLLEAMAMARPLITTDVPGCRETVAHGDNGFLVPMKSVEKLMQAMKYFLDDSERVVGMGNRSRKLAMEKYEVHAVNQQILCETVL